MNNNNLFPLQIDSKVDSPEAIASLLQFGNNKKLSASEINKMVDAINFLSENIGSSASLDKLISIGEITLQYNEISIPASAIWKIANINYSNTGIVQKTIVPAAQGANRTDLLVANQNNNFDLIQGIETETIAISPNLPSNTVLVTQIQVTDTGASEVFPPETGLNYILKAESIPVNIGILDDEAVILNFISSNLNIVDHVGKLNSIASAPEYLRKGKVYSIKNSLETPLVIKHLGTNGNIYISFPNEEDFTLQENEIVQFLYNQAPGQNPKLEFIGRIIEQNNTPVIVENTVIEGSTNAVSGAAVFTEIENLQDQIEAVPNQTTNIIPKKSSTGTLVDSQIFDNGGNVGIGTSTPAEKLDVRGSIKLFGYLTLNSEDGDFGESRIYSLRDSTTGNSGYSGKIVFAPKYFDGSAFSFPERMVIASNGNVGIGTSTPASILHLKQGGYPSLIIEGGTDAGSGVSFQGNVLYASMYGEFESPNNGQFLFRTRRNGSITLAMAIKSTGNVGIGTDSPTEKLEVNGRIKLQPATQANHAVALSQIAQLINTTNSSYVLTNLSAQKTNIFGSSTSGITLVLPEASLNAGKEITLTSVSNVRNYARLESFTESATEIRYKEELFSFFEYATSYQLISNGTNWVIVNILEQ